MHNGPKYGLNRVGVQKWPHGGSSQSVAYLQHHAKTLKLTGTDGQADRMTDGQDHVLSQADALTKKRSALMTHGKCYL